eukprot:CAMPEP_0174266534 /NCGR_PEP_ID=MMETSP0439-20130205/30573_1 /TAXON_ID=0 /ORGANISM="Stereomyxa ramosa, Strain Chinc5" /LENGTH=598 /DNA_ID=CAMNT_0015353561 /DNA_START=1 /DNA_END=1797 /DNA_ORIENTATION=-
MFLVDFLLFLLHKLTIWIFRIILQVFFHDIELVGRENVPKKGAVIFVGNHNNQFIDVMILLCHAGRQIAFVTAAVSLKRKVIGFFAKILQSIPVTRLRDISVVCTGKIHTAMTEEEVELAQVNGDVEGAHLFGEGTAFLSEVQKGHTILDVGKVKEVIDDTHLVLTRPLKKPLEPTGFRCAPPIDHSQLFSSVWKRLSKGKCIGIFPEGSSHDGTELLPLKAGVTMMALGAVDKHSVSVRIVPCGFSYYYGHRFRGNVILEFGKPIVISPGPGSHAQQRLERYRNPAESRVVCSELLHDIERGLKSVILNAPSYEDQKNLFIIRSIYQPYTILLPSNQYNELNRKLADIFFVHYADDPEVKALFKEVEAYKEWLLAYGMQDHQVPPMEGEDEKGHYIFWLRAVKRFILLSILIVIALPCTIINAPIGLLARLVALKQRERVAPNDPHAKYGALDVAASYKVIVAGCGVPAYYLLYFIMAWISWGFRWAFAVLFFLPFFSYASILTMERASREWNILRVSTTLKRSTKRLKYVRKLRNELEEHIKSVIQKLGPTVDPTFWESITQSMASQEEEVRKKQDPRKSSVVWRTISYKKLADYI